MNNPNEHIENFLDYYCLFKQEPGYAVLLKGKWGTGKTWFIKKYMENLDVKGVKHLYVSLYGKTNFEEIEYEFYKLLNPILASKGMAIASKIAKSFLKLTLKIDIDGDGRSDGSATAQIPDLNLPDYLTNTGDFVLIFDDLERAFIDIENMLGYINYFVEHQGYKVIILANEEELINRDQQDSENNKPQKYQRIKEKLIGKTFEVKPSFDAALSDFISTVENNHAKNLYMSNTDIISDVYNDSGHNSLRHLKQALWDFERLIDSIDNTALKKSGLLLGLLKVFLIFSFEIKSGAITAADIANLQNEHLEFLLSIEGDPRETKYLALRKKYKFFNLDDLIINDRIWVEIFSHGYCSSEKMMESLEKSKFYLTETTPAWVKLWHFMTLREKDFRSALAAVSKDFRKNKFKNYGEVLHVTGILLELSSAQLFALSRCEILSLAINNINHLKENGGLVSIDHIHRGSSLPIDKESWGGLGYREISSEEVKKLIVHIELSMKQAATVCYEKAAKKLLRLMKTDTELFCESITFSHGPNSKYFDLAIFSYVAAHEFVKRFNNTSPESKRLICNAFYNRYRDRGYVDSLLPELDWIKQVIDLLKSKKGANKGKLSNYQLQIYIDKYFTSALQSLLAHTESRSH